jgi:hypothetical protein
MSDVDRLQKVLTSVEAGGKQFDLSRLILINNKRG